MNKKSITSSPAGQPLLKDSVSIIIPTYNDEDTIERCLESLLQQNYRKKEIIIVNDGSTDKTQEIVRRLAEKPKVKVVDTPHSGRSYARNVGLREAGGELVAFAEADGVYGSNYVQSAVKHFSDPLVGGVLLSGRVWKPESFIQKCVDVELAIRDFRTSTGKFKPISAWVYRTELVRQIGGFDVALEIAEDRDLATRVKKEHKIAFEPGVNWWHPAPKSITDFMTRGYRHGKLRAPFCKKYPEKIPYRELVAFTLLVTLIALAIVNSIFLMILLGAVFLEYSLKLASLVRDGWRLMIEKKYLLFLPLVSLLRLISFTLGFIVGMLTPVYVKR